MSIEDSEEQRLRKLLGEESEEDTRTELEKQADALLENPLPTPRRDLSAIDAEFEERKRTMDQRLATSKPKAVEEVRKRSGAPVSIDQDSGRGLAAGMSVAYAIIGLPIIFGLVGLFVDRTFHTSLVGGFTVIGVVLALVYTVMVMNRQNRS